MKSIRSKAKWTLLLSAVWLMLTAGDLVSWAIGLPFIAMAILLQPDSKTSDETKHETSDDKTILKSSPFPKILGLIQFSFFFIVESVRGGWDVSRRVLARKPKVDPVFFDYSMQLQLPSSKQFFMSSVSLLPGTLSADLRNNQVRIHSLDQDTNTTQGVKRLEYLVGKIFGETF